jgi:hypothetical protein
MKITQKGIIAVILTAGAGAGIYEARQASIWRSQARMLQQAAAANAADIERLNRERDDAVARQTALEGENERLLHAVNNLPNLRAELERLRAIEQQQAQSKSTSQKPYDPFSQSVLTLTSHAGNITNFSPDTWFIVEKAPVDKDYDSCFKFGNGRTASRATGIGEARDPDAPY